MSQPTQAPLTNDQTLFLRNGIVSKDLLVGWSFAKGCEMARELEALGLWRVEPDAQGWSGITDEGLRRLGTPHARRILSNRASSRASA